MRHVSIEVAETVRDRLAVLAAERGTTIARLVGDFAARTPTKSERAGKAGRAEWTERNERSERSARPERSVRTPGGPRPQEKPGLPGPIGLTGPTGSRPGAPDGTAAEPDGGADGGADAELIRRFGDCVVSVGLHTGVVPPVW